jgi:sulfur carrier protein
MTANIQEGIIQVNGKEEILTANTVAELLRSRGIESRRGVAVAVNGAVVPAGAWESRWLAPGDEVEIVRPFGGG